MRGDWNHYGYHMGHHGWQRRNWHHRRGGFLWIFPVMFFFFMMSGLFRFFWPLLVIGLVIMVIKGAALRSHYWNDRDWSDKFKNDEKWKNDDFTTGEKPKRDETDSRRYVQTEDGEWLEII